MVKVAVERTGYLSRNMFASYAIALSLLGSHATFALSNSTPQADSYNFNPHIESQQIWRNPFLLGKKTGVYIDTEVADCQDPMAGGLAELEVSENTDGEVAIGINNNEDSGTILDGVQIKLAKETMEVVDLNGSTAPTTLDRNTTLGDVQKLETSDNHAVYAYTAEGTNGQMYNYLTVSCTND